MYSSAIITSLLCLQEKVDALRVLGADVKLVPAVPFDNPDNYNHQVRRKPWSKTIAAKWGNMVVN